MLMLRKTAGAIPRPPRSNVRGFLRRFNVQPRALFHHKLVLGIETSCDDTAAAVVDETGNVLGEALHSQTEVHLKTGGKKTFFNQTSRMFYNEWWESYRIFGQRRK